MRFDTPIWFAKTNNVYNAASGDYETTIVGETMRYASVTSAQIDTLRLVYGEIKQGCLTVRLLMPYTEPFDYIRIGAKVYRVDYSRLLRTKQTFVVSEVQNGINQS